MLFCFGLAFDFPTEGSLRKWIYSQAWAKGVCTTVIHLKPSGWGEVWPNSVLGSSISVCAGACWKCARTHLLLAVALFSHPFLLSKASWDCSNPEGSQSGGVHRTGSAIWWLRKFLAGWGKTFLLEVNGATNFQVHWPGARKTAVPAASLGPCGLITNSNVGCSRNRPEIPSEIVRAAISSPAWVWRLKQEAHFQQIRSQKV